MFACSPLQNITGRHAHLSAWLHVFSFSFLLLMKFSCVLLWRRCVRCDVMWSSALAPQASVFSSAPISVSASSSEISAPCLQHHPGQTAAVHFPMTRQREGEKRWESQIITWFISIFFNVFFLSFFLTKNTELLTVWEIYIIFTSIFIQSSYTAS